MRRPPLLTRIELANCSDCPMMNAHPCAGGHMVNWFCRAPRDAFKPSLREKLIPSFTEVPAWCPLQRTVVVLVVADPST